MSGAHVRPVARDVVLVADAVTVRYRSGPAVVTVLDGVSLTVAAGEVVCLSGPSGSGKSTLCHVVAGFEDPSSGTVTVAGQGPTGLHDWAAIAVVPQRLGLVPELTVAESVALPRALRGAAADAAHDGGAGLPSVQSLLAELALDGLGHRYVGETSMGEQQRTAIARARSLDPTLLVLDEPTGSQDDEHVDRVLAAIGGAAVRGSAVLVSTHDDRVLAVADRVVGLSDGRVT
ncbi:ABC transporter ATP-binding protein [Actinotalea sp. Marseille-Q4924]|uniref:ABC transporter ATP-binding protein n=1 Tax=Actinotalea sp. Marseille-Q4924 TaxID=2866571 RepID=UPI001CE3CF73|nr:ATP-binding cassette domain-containing protein [Actinotalea sp. Marseille-Q4924]